MITNNQEPGISTSQKNAHRKVDINWLVKFEAKTLTVFEL